MYFLLVSLLLYYLPTCPHSRQVLDYLEDHHKTVPMVNLSNNPKGKEELVKAGGEAIVPCLVIDGRALYDADAIIKWMSENPDTLSPAN